MKKRIFIGIAVLFVLHFVTWKIWGERALLKKGYTFLENKEECQNQFSIMTYSEEYEDTVYNYIGKKMYRFGENFDLKELEFRLDSEIKYAHRQDSVSKSKMYQLIDSTDYYIQLNFISLNNYNPCLASSFYECWAVDTDWNESHQPYLIWGFFGWIEMTNRNYLVKNGFIKEYPFQEFNK